MKPLLIFYFTLLTQLALLAQGPPCDSALYFDGNNDYVRLTTTTVDGINQIGTGDFTFEAWINGAPENQQNAHPPIFSNRGAGQGTSFFFHSSWPTATGNKLLSIQLGGANYLILNNGNYNNSVLDSTCHHVAISRLGSILSFYIDGSLIGTRVIAGNPSISSTATKNIGRDALNGNEFEGEIRDLRIWNTALTAAQINQQMNTPLTGGEPGLVCNLGLNEGSGQIVSDNSPSNYQGRLGNTLSPDGSDPSWINSSCCCSEVINESISCDASGYTYSFEIRNKTNQIVDGIIVDGVPIFGLNIPPNGIYGPHTISIPINTFPSYCFSVVLLTQGLDCCHIDHCVPLPPCEPCDSIALVADTLVTNDGGCCYEVDVINNFDDSYFTKIVSTILTPGVTFDNPSGDLGWIVSGAGNTLTWQSGLPFIDDITHPGVLNFCFTGINQTSQTPQVVQFDWITTGGNGQDSVACSDTLQFNCKPCLDVKNDTIFCLPNGDYQYCMTIWNNDPVFTANEVFFQVYSPAATSFTPNPVLVTIPPTSATSVCVTIPGPLATGTQVKYRTILKNLTGDTLNWCCMVDTFMVEIPPCDMEPTDTCVIAEQWSVQCEDINGDGQLDPVLSFIPYGMGSIQVSSSCGTLTPNNFTVPPNTIQYASMTNWNGCNPMDITFVYFDPLGNVCGEETILIDVPCPLSLACFCEDLQANVFQGFQQEFNCPDGNFTPNALQNCDGVLWYVNDAFAGSTTGNASLVYTYPGPGVYDVCMAVIRTDDNGVQCESIYCEEITIVDWPCLLGFPVMEKFEVYPNPTSGSLITLRLKGEKLPQRVTVEIRDLSGPVVKSFANISLEQSGIQMDVSDLKPGMYIIHMLGQEAHIPPLRFVKMDR